MLCPAAGSSARHAAGAGFYLARDKGVLSACLCNVVRAGVLPRIMSELMQVAAHLMMRKPFRRKQCKDEELSGVLGRKEGRKRVGVEP